ncbi:MAG TPA: hypothetical protein GX497_14510 [Bacillus bacterium]|nr:hypothetical protein [Bacillus sp. (in: firmicutes)]
MGQIQSSDELMEYIQKMNRDNSVLQFSIRGKGKFTLVLQEEDEQSIKADVEANHSLEQMINESRIQYKEGLGMSTSEVLKSLSVKDFM